MSIIASPPALTNFVGMLSTRADVPIFSALTVASSRMIGKGSSSDVRGQSSTVGPPSVL